MHFNSALTATLVLAGTAFAQPAANIEDGSILARQSDDLPDVGIEIPSAKDRFNFSPGSIRPAVCGIGAWSGCKREADPEAKDGTILARRSNEVPDSGIGIPEEVKFAPGTIRPDVCGFGYGNCKREANPEAEDGSIMARQSDQNTGSSRGSLDEIIQRFRDQETKGGNVGGGIRPAACGYGWSGCKRDAQQEQDNSQPEPKSETQVERPFGLRQRSGVGGNMVAFPAVCGRWYSSCKRSPKPVAEAGPEPEAEAEAEALEIPEGRFKVDESKFPPGTARLAVCGIGAWSGCKREAEPQQEAQQEPETLPLRPWLPSPPEGVQRRPGGIFPAVCGRWYSSC
ncbi:hypothetical protein CB0940_06142 [Cercospora beticola]|uniref:Uncharacterized protein n=1 Tax=Cercospora beticola TaxID=122368 RepID=A0A2G5HYF9_CERBT|nr:hypothetical protein CB0940_06142 [Cercospora beticola]PIA97585.1 hypothetical protein CB0940_06142 [Cercospora beticola]WPA98757.1 hypothetical protein RHO25_003370 [Cercospora beticola]